MRRVGVIVGCVAAAMLAVVLVSPSGQERRRVDVVFDSAKGLVPGQAVKIAGTPVGTIEDVELVTTPGGGYRARLRLAVDRRFVPFHSDASCQILPQGLLSENYVECDPGSPSASDLAADASGVPTVPVSRTSIPASLQNLLDTFAMPTSERVALVLDTLGLGTAGHGADLNAIVRRANPALTQTRTVLRMVGDQRAQLRDAITQTDRILGGLAADDGSVRRFVTGAATLAQTTASQRSNLEEAINRLPGTLDAVATTLPSVQRLSRDGTPLLRSLRTSAPQINRFITSFDAFAKPAPRALAAVSSAAASGRQTVKPALPVAADLRRLATAAVPAVRDLDALAANARDRGVFEFLDHLNYGLSTGTSAFDRNGHLLLIFLDAIPRCIIGSLTPGTQSPPGCSHAFSAPGSGQIPASQAPPSGSPQTRLTANSINGLLDYLLK